MGQYRGLLAGLAALGFMFGSLQLLSGALQRLPWGRLAQAPPPEPELVAPIVRKPQQERGLLPPARSETGTVPLYRESRPSPAPRPEPIRAPGYAAGPPRSEPAKGRAAATPRPKAPPAAPSRFKIEGFPALGERFGAPAAAPAQGQAQPAGGGPAPAPVAPLPAAPRLEPEPEPASAWDQGAPAAAPEAAPRQRRTMRPVLQGGVATTPVEEDAPLEEPPE